MDIFSRGTQNPKIRRNKMEVKIDLTAMLGELAGQVVETLSKQIAKDLAGLVSAELANSGKVIDIEEAAAMVDEAIKEEEKDIPETKKKVAPKTKEKKAKKEETTLTLEQMKAAAKRVYEIIGDAEPIKQIVAAFALDKNDTTLTGVPATSYERLLEALDSLAHGE
jgi:hypothetical protein